jgi:hypothetical protein
MDISEMRGVPTKGNDIGTYWDPSQLPVVVPHNSRPPDLGETKLKFPCQFQLTYKEGVAQKPH